MRPADTSEAAWRVQHDVWRAMGPDGRFRAMAALSDALYASTRADIRRKRPAWTELQVTLALVARLHGRELAARCNGGRAVPDP